MAGETIVPITATDEEQTAPRLTIDPSIAAPDGSFWAFNGEGYSQIVEPWAIEEHIGPTKASESFGDVESWAAYVLRFAANEVDPSDGVLLVWNQAYLRATLDYHANGGTPDRCQWTATHTFLKTRQLMAWEQLASGRAISQKALIEALEDRRDDVAEPDAASLVEMLRKLRATVNATAKSEIQPNGATKIEYSRQTQTSLELPPTITIGIPVLKGHTAPDEQGVEGPVVYRIEVRIRVDEIGDDGRVVFRLTMPNAEAALEDAVADRVAKAKALLGEQFVLYRAAGG